MIYTTRPLRELDFRHASELDKKWFGDNGISEEELRNNLKNQKSIGIFNQDTLLGFSIFEILNQGLPTDYKSILIPSGKVLFVQQFTTQSNYAINAWELDAFLLGALEEKARELHCIEIWEALAKDHPYKKENNPKFDAFDFYVAHGFTYDDDIDFTWQPNANTSIGCYLFRKKM